MADNKLIGQNYTTPDLDREGHGQGEVRGGLPRRGDALRQAAPQPDAARAREEHRHERGAGPAGCQSHSDADDLPEPASGMTDGGQVVQASMLNERALTNEPRYRGEPILAVAAVDELTAAEAIELIQIEYEPLPFNVDPIADAASRRAERPDGRQRLDARARRRRHRARSPTTGPVAYQAGYQRAEVDRRRLRRVQRRQDADGRGRRSVAPVVLRRRRGRLQGCGARSRRDVFDGGQCQPAAREPLDDGVLAERQALPARLDAEHGADGSRRRALGRHRGEPGGGHQRIHRWRVRQQGGRFDSRWPFRRCSPRRPARR